MPRKKRSAIKGNKLSAFDLKTELIRIFKLHPDATFNPKQLSRRLRISNSPDAIKNALEELLKEGKLVQPEEFRFKLAASTQKAFASKVHEGIVDMTRQGSAYIVCEGLDNDVFVSAKNMNTALHGDKVKLRVWIPRGRKKPEGEVVEVLERAKEHFIGTLWQYPEFALVYPDGNTNMDIYVEAAHTKGAKDGDKVVVYITDWSQDRMKGPKGEVTTVLGAAGTSDIEMKAILINAGFELEFEAEVIRQAEALPDEIEAAEIARRRDMREVTTFTIDPDTARDFDDALSVAFIEEGLYEIGVHIADVSHYIRPGTALDKEAMERSTSVYLVDRVLPMLPEKLSNELCSLRPNEDKLTFSAIFRMDDSGRVRSRWFGKTVIHSDRRFTYEEAQEVLENKSGDFEEELLLLNKLAHKLREKRFRKGSIAFEVEEVKFRLDEAGVPIEVYTKERKDAHMLIEDFMLLANREVATYIHKKGEEEEIPFVYRIHDEPNPDKVLEFAAFAGELGFRMDVSNPAVIAKSYNKLVEATQTRPQLKILEPLAIRTMAKAAYSSNNIGHYGLGFEFYSHFTSPIRRYSDVLAHRILERNLSGKDPFRVDKSKLEEVCGHISRQERKALEAERESIKYKQVEFIKKHVGEVFTGYVTGFSDRGLYVELARTRIEGRVSFDTLDEGFDVAPGRMRIKGLKTGKEYKMGDEILVQIVRADLASRQVDMMLAKEAPMIAPVFE